MVLAVSHYLATKPEGGVLICLVIALVLFALAAIVAFPARAWPYVIHAAIALAAAGLFFLTLAFVV